ncbi:MAG TPA: GFA family protein [Gammaproteobacteria bacterium]|nr:GFA family protein [Gammaproteobacteria bacterium]
MLTASCHCSAVRIEIPHAPRTLTECNCSICFRYGARWAHHTRATARVVSPPDAARAYLWGDREIEFYHCRICGCLTHYESVAKDPDSRISVNARMLPPAELAGVPVRHFDGASSWEFLD